MSRRTKYTAEAKYEILKAYENGSGTMQEIFTKYKISADAFYKWKYNYSKYGIDRLRKSGTWKKYSKDLKQLAVKDYLSGQFSQREIVKKYEISTREVLKGWVNKYNVHREIKAVTKGMSQSMTKGRATSWKERIEIVLYCINQNNDYQQVAEVYNVSYQQVYQWVKKYEFGRENALKDRRGRKKFEEELTSEDRTKFSIKKLEVKNERLRAENAFLKKLEELERGGY
jgi:transposase-like protein